LDDGPACDRTALEVREWGFSTQLFERYQRAEKSRMATLVEMYVQGVSTRKVKGVTEELCGRRFSASAISAVVKKLHGEFRAFAEREFSDAFPCLILDVRYERVREAGVITSPAVLIAAAVDSEGRRQVLAVALANCESGPAGATCFWRLWPAGCAGVEFVVSNDHPGLKQATHEILPQAAWQRCYVHFVMRWITCRTKSTMTACRSFAGYTIGTRLAKCAATSRNGSSSGRASTPSLRLGGGQHRGDP
jgi:transposase-like protein